MMMEKTIFNQVLIHFSCLPDRVIELLLEREKEMKLMNFSMESYAMVASKIGHEESTFNSGTIESLLKLEYSGGPNSIIIPGRLHFTEDRFNQISYYYV